MYPSANEFRPTDHDHLLDLLVDGELDEPGRRDLLSWCQRDPDGWRRCALAFLEAQSWRHELDRPASESTAAEQVERRPAAAPAPSEPARRRGPARPIAVSLCMAASFLLAFTLGLWVRGGWQPEIAGPPAPDAGAVVEADGRQTPSRMAASRRSHDVLPASDRFDGPWTNVRLQVGDPSGAIEEIELPVVERQAWTDEWLVNQPAALPAEIEQALEKMGHQVTQRRQFFPIELDDGRRLIVPVDQVEVTPVGDRTYQ